MTSIGIRDLKNNLSRVLRLVVTGVSVDVTDHGHVVARLTPPPRDESAGSVFQRLVESGVIKPAVDGGKPSHRWPVLKRPRARRGLAAALIDADRGD